jgi:hypothetical protein
MAAKKSSVEDEHVGQVPSLDTNMFNKKLAKTAKLAQPHFATKYYQWKL